MNLGGPRKNSVRSPRLPARPLWATRGVGLQATSGRVGPDWARLLAQRLRSSNLLGVHQQTQLNLQLWADCGGLGTAQIAATALGEALGQCIGIEIRWNLYCYCDKDKVAREFVKRNFKPQHISDDMDHRNFETNTFACSTCNCNHPLPKAGIDLYVAGFPYGLGVACVRAGIHRTSSHSRLDSRQFSA